MEIVIELINEGADVNQLDEVRVVSQQSLSLVHVGMYMYTTIDDITKD